MDMKRAMKIALQSCAIALVAMPAFAQEVTFAYRFEPGSSERHRVKLNQEVDWGGMAMSYLADMEVTVKCLSAKDGKYEMEMKFDKADVSMTMMGTPQVSPLGEQLVGQSVLFTADANGEVSGIKPATVFDAWEMAQQIVEPVLKGWYPHLPNKAVAMGGEWKKAGEKETESSGSETLTNASFKFKEMRKEKTHDVAVVEQTLDSTISGTSATPMGTYQVAGGGKGKAEFLFDPAKSRVEKLKGKVDISMDMTPQAGGDAVKAVVISHVERNLLE
jgi:hypothetical protein